MTAVRGPAFSLRSPTLAGTILVAVTLMAYLPALRGGFIWDDDQYVAANPAVSAPGGLARIWLVPSASPQYYPATLSSFWLEYRLFRADPVGSHLTNVLLHAASALLLGAALRRLGVRGAWLAAALFALHPVHVESVAWITERKNVLSGFFYLLAAHAWIRFAPPVEERRGGAGAWTLAFALFLCALLSKSVTGTFPAAMLLLVWWKRGRIGPRDVAPLLPFFAAAVAMGSATAWIEKHRVGAWGPDWDLSFLERLMVAGRAPWFYLGKLLWPEPLMFVYPRFPVSSADLALSLYPGVTVLACLGLWLARRKLGRGPLAAALFFLGTLFPALSFVNVFPMLYSFVADHFQYLASIGPIAGLAALAARASESTPRRRAASRLAAASVLLALATQTWSHAGAFADSETLWRDTLEKNPAAWMAHTNLASLLHVSSAGIDDPQARARRLDEAEEHYRASLALRPDGLPARIQLAKLYEARGDLARAEAEYRSAIAVLNRYPPGSRGHARAADPWYAYGGFLAERGRAAEAIACYRRALAILPESATVRTDLGKLLLETGAAQEAREQFLEALRLDPRSANAANNLGVLEASEGNLERAIALWELALRAAPGHAEARSNLQKARVQREGARTGPGGD